MKYFFLLTGPAPITRLFGIEMCGMQS